MHRPTGNRVLVATAVLCSTCLALLVAISPNRTTSVALEQIAVVFPVEQVHEYAAPTESMFEAAQQQMLWGGQGKVTTGTSVDGRPTVPGLHTDCVPGVLHSDCSPAQEDGAWSVDAADWLDRHTDGGHSNTMQKIQDDVDRAFAEREQFLDDCLQDASLCSGRRSDASIGARMKGNYGDTPKWGSRTHPWAPEQGADFGEYNNDGHWSHVELPSGTRGDGGLVSDSYYANSV